MSKKEINLEEIAQLNKIKSKTLSQLLIRALKLDKLNGLYGEISEQSGHEFIDAVLSKLDIEFEINEKDLNNIPESGAFITIGNHPYGGIDGLILLSIMLKKRPDYKIMVNYMLSQFKEIESHTIEIDPFERKRKSGMNTKGLKRSLNYLKEGIPVGLFPAGEVSSLHLNNLRISDKIWHPVSGKLIKKANVKVVPIYFSGHNSIFFNLLGLINPALRTIRLPAEMLNKRQKIKVRIGKPIPTSVLNEFEDIEQMMRFLRAKTYALGSTLNVKEFYFRTQKENEVETIIEPVDSNLLLGEINQLKEGGKLLISNNAFDVLLGDAKEIPNVLKEITRLREITFREIGEGTNKSADSDEFDLYYKHLILWDKIGNKLAGGYRIGMGKSLFEKYRKKGFYLNTLFKFNKEFNPIFSSSLELGRSFITKEYQRNPYALVMLWKGIYEIVRKDSEIKYLIGPVSISNKYAKLSKEILVQYIRKNHFDKTLASYVKPRKKYKYNQKSDTSLIKDFPLTELKFVDQLISDIEPDGAKIPVMVKKYLAQNAKIISFNVDPDFNNSLDGLVVVNLNTVPENTFKMLD